MTATINQPKSILLNSRRGTSGSLVKRSCATFGRKSTSTSVLITGKLKNLRNYYASRRPSIQPRTIFVVPPEQPRRSSIVRFQPNALVCHIPSRKDYTKEERRAMWIPRRELKKLILKNHSEYAFEGRDWRTVPEEDEFGTDDQGQLIHPLQIAQKKMKTSPLLVSPRLSQTKTNKLNRLRSRKLPLSKPAVIEEEEDEEPDHKRPYSNLEEEDEDDDEERESKRSRIEHANS